MGLDRGQELEGLVGEQEKGNAYTMTAVECVERQSGTTGT